MALGRVLLAGMGQASMHGIMSIYVLVPGAGVEPFHPCRHHAWQLGGP
jgi:hypothetical protein